MYVCIYIERERKRERELKTGIHFKEMFIFFITLRKLKEITDLKSKTRNTHTQKKMANSFKVLLSNMHPKSRMPHADLCVFRRLQCKHA